MSQVLALKAGAAGRKRPFDDMAVDTPLAACSPHRISFLETPNVKRMRMIGREGNNNNSVGGVVHGGVVKRSMSKEEGEEMVRHVPKRLRRLVVQVVGRGGSSSERLFTIDDVRDIVESVVGEKVGKVKEDCEKVLKERLTDQWKVFTRYHEDFVARSYRGRELSYLS